MVPSSVAKMKMAGFPDGVPLSRRKSVALPLNTVPVGVDSVPGGAKSRRWDDYEVAGAVICFDENVNGASTGVL
jgi:hypothetical protein